MIEDSSSPDIDHNLYSRQIGAFGVEAMGKLIKLRVLIQGMSGVSSRIYFPILDLFQPNILDRT